MVYALTSANASAGNQDQNKNDSLLNELKIATEDAGKVNLFNIIAWELRHSNPDTSIILSNQALELAQKKQWQKGIAESYHNLGVFNRQKGNYSQSLEYNFKSLEILKKLNDKKAVSASLGNIGNVYKDQCDYPAALKHFFEALEIGKELGDKACMAADLGNIGIVYWNQGDYPAALKHYFEALEIGKELGDKNGVAVQLCNIGIVYWNQGDLSTDDSVRQVNYSNALKHLFEALKIFKELGSKNYIAAILGNIGVVYKTQGDLSTDDTVRQVNYSNALKYYFEALDIDRELGNNRGIAIRFGNIGTLHTKTGKFTQAQAYLDRALALCDSIGALNYTMQFEKSLSHLLDTTGRYRLALAHYKKYSAAKDSLFNEEKSKNIGKLEAKHEFEMAEMERKKREEEIVRITEEKKKRRNILQYSGILIFIVLMFIGVSMLGRLTLSVRWAEGIVFFTFLLFFEFTLVLLDPYIEQFSAGAPAIKLAFNAVLAGLIFPLHSFFEEKLKKTTFRKKRERI
ncbi:MAG: tetratricopeptide repeat protein [Bacteroidota bacterium]